MNDPNAPPGGQPWRRQPPPGGPPPQGAGDGYGPPPGGTGLATTSLVLGIFSFCALALAGIPAAICGILALAKGTPAKGQAIAGLVLGALGTLATIPAVFVVIGLLLPAAAKVREAASRAKDSNSLMQVGLAFHNHEATTTRFPPADDGKVSWRVHLLPYLEQQALYKQFDLRQAWDGPANKRLADTRVPTYASTADPETETRTHWRVFTGPKTIFPPKGPLNFAGISDGTSNTILTIETTDTVPWPEPREVPYTPSGALPAFGHKDRPTFLVGMADGSVRSVKKTVSEATLRAAVTADANDVVGADW